MVSTGCPSRGSGSGGLGLSRELLARLPTAVAYVAGPDLVFEFASEGYRRAVGGRDLIGCPFREALPEVVGQPRFEALRRVLETGEPCRVRGEEVRLRRHGAEPELAYIDLAYEPVRDEAGLVAGVLIFGADVSDHVRDRQRLEELANSLHRSEERYRTLFETLPHGIVLYERDGSVIEANPAAVEVSGLPPGEMTAADCARLTSHEDGTPYRPDELPAMVALRTGEMVSGVLVSMRNARTGEVRWVQVTGVPAARDAQGRSRRAYSVFTDITEERRAQAGLRESNRLLGRLREANVLGVVVANEEGIQEANDAFLGIVGYTRHDLEAGSLTWDALTPREWVHLNDESVEQLRRTGAFRPYDKEYLHRDGYRVPVLVGAALLDRDPLRWATFVVDLTARQRGEQERAELLAREQAARVAADAAQDRLASLLDAGNLVAATGSRQQLRDQAAQLMVPALADSCAVLPLTAEGMLRAASVVHRDPAKAAILDELRAIDIPPDGPLLQVPLTQATTRLVTDVSAMMSATSRAPREVADILKRVPLESMIVMPLLIGPRTAGVVVLGRDAGRPRFTEADVPVIEELSRRLAIGMANVETFAREHTVAETLQHALLPDAPLEIAGLDLAVRYLPATDGVHVGGDWYDVFPLGGDQVALAIGDVAGHSIGSASVMGQVRSLLRAYALQDPAPADVLTRTNAAVCQLLPDAVATVFYAVLDLSTGDLAYANAGHPPALLGSGEGHVEYLDCASGTMLGASADADYPVGHRRLAPGARLLLYTDGLIEDRRRDIAEGFGALARAMRRCLTQTAEQTCQFVQAAMLGSGTRADDVCILAIRIQDQPALRRPGAAGPASDLGQLLHSGTEAGPQMTEIADTCPITCPVAGIGWDFS
ncbi:MAG: putative sensor protein [Actinomycetia bacterium]|nr:putative sensor protein [Actinomycetes bacterium]